MTDRYTLHHGNSLHILTELDDQSIDSIVTDPPYELGFMGKKWDASGIAYSIELWAECLRVLKPGGHLLAFGGTRTYHRMTVAIEDAGFEIRDSIHWLYGSGFPKSHDVSKAIDKQAGAERGRVPFAGGIAPGSHNYGGGCQVVPVGATKQDNVPITDEAKRWEGWGTALKPAHEPIVLARKPLNGTVANNVLQHGTGALNIDRCRVGYASEADKTAMAAGVESIRERGGVVEGSWKNSSDLSGANPAHTAGRWPANIIIDDWIADIEDDWPRYFYCAKPSRAERDAGLDDIAISSKRVTDFDLATRKCTVCGSRSNRNGRWPDCDHDNWEWVPMKAEAHKGGNPRNIHPTVKPLALIRYLIRLITPPHGTVLDPFAGSGTTLAAAIIEGHHPIGIELTDDYLPIIHGRCQHAITQHDNQPQPQPTLFETPND